MENRMTANLKVMDQNAIAEFKQGVSGMLPDFEMLLYGSKARGTDVEFSDIDILLLTPQKITKAQAESISWIKYEVELKFNVVIGLIIEHDQFWQSPLAQAMPFHWVIDREGIRI